MIEEVSSVKCQVLRRPSQAGSPLRVSCFRLHTSHFRRNAGCPLGFRAKQSQFQRSGGALEGEVRKTNQIPAITPIRRSAFPGKSIVRNKASCRCQDSSPPPLGPSASLPPSRLRQTKPNLGKMGYLEDASRRHIMRNKPNSAQLGAGPTPLRAKRAKQTQFIDCGLRIHKGLWPAAKARAAGCTNKPNWPEPIVPNKPNLPGGAGRCGARSLVQTNPIRPRGRASGVREGKNAQNEANFGRTFKCRVSSGKWGKTGWPSSKSSHFRLRTLHFKLSSRTASGGRT
jgi:hypothetical protein